MLLVFRTIITSLPLMSVPALAAVRHVETGITSVGPAMFLFTIAAALLLTLLLRSTIRHLSGYVAHRIGRWRIQRALAKRSKDVMSDFILPGAFGGLARIDHAVMTAGGILCVREIHCNGVVFGSADDPQWTHVDGARRRRFLNPLIQNEGRAKALQQVVPDIPVANLVVFTGSVDFTTPPPANVIRIGQIRSFIKKFVFGPSKVKDWDAAWMSVKSAAMTDEATRKDFAAQVGFG